MHGNEVNLISIYNSLNRLFFEACRRVWQYEARLYKIYFTA